jgi:hypothetical protein
LGHMGDSLNFVDSGIGERLHDGRIRSYPGGHRRHLVGNPTYSVAKKILTMWPRAGEGEVFGKVVVNDDVVNPTRVTPSFAKEEADEKIIDCFNVFVRF